MCYYELLLGSKCAGHTVFRNRVVDHLVWWEIMRGIPLNPLGFLGGCVSSSSGSPAENDLVHTLGLENVFGSSLDGICLIYTLPFKT